MGTYIQILIILIAIGGPVLGRVIQSLEKQRKIRQRQREVEARRLEALRTGRTSETGGGTRIVSGATQAGGGTAEGGRDMAPSAGRGASTTRAQEIAQRRQEQLEALRRRQQTARDRAARPTQSGPQPTRTTQGRPGPQRSPSPRPAQPRPGAARGPGAAGPGARQGAGGPGIPLTPVAPPSTPPIKETEIDEYPITHTAIGAGSAYKSGAKARRGGGSLLGEGMSASDWRRFIVAREVLSAPMALRRPGEESVL